MALSAQEIVDPIVNLVDPYYQSSVRAWLENHLTDKEQAAILAYLSKQPVDDALYQQAINKLPDGVKKALFDIVIKKGAEINQAFSEAAEKYCKEVNEKNWGACEILKPGQKAPSKETLERAEEKQIARYGCEPWDALCQTKMALGWKPKGPDKLVSNTEKGIIAVAGGILLGVLLWLLKWKR
jgi:hypothetical protein